jgi:hypothetical protein
MKVKSIEEVAPRRVYAVRTSTGTFVADGLAHHNCYGCNVMSQGRQYEFGIAIDELYGEGTAKALHGESKQLHPFTLDELQEIIKDSKQQIKFYEGQ